MRTAGHPDSAAHLTRGVVAVGVLLLTTATAGCTGGPRLDDAEPAPSATSGAPARGPLDELLLQLGGGNPLEQDDPAAAAVEQMRRSEEAIAACMIPLGFEYTPSVPAVSDVVISDGPVRGTREYVERYGYGVTNGPSDEGGSMSWSLEGPSTQGEYVESLSPAAREAYDTALWGPVIDRGDDDSVTRSGGCQESAQAGGDGGDAFDAIRAEAYAFLEALPDDPALAELDTAWSRCMADQGYVYSSPAATEQSFWDRQQALVDPDTSILDPDSNAALAEEELATARADLACQDETGYAAEHAAIAADLQQGWLDLHRTEVDAWVDAVNLPSDPPTNP